MNLDAVLKKYNFPEEACKALTATGIKKLFPPQAEAIEQGVLDGKNLLLAVPTAAGKTFVAELCMLKKVLGQEGRCLYIAPLKALVSEKYEDFKRKYEPLGIKVGQATGDYDASDKFLHRYQILVATAEKVDSLLRAKAHWLINSLSVVILDEIHFINDGERGPTLEILIARIRQLNPKVQMLALSATIHNAKEMADWLKTNLVVSDWRPIPLKEGVYFSNQIKFNQYASKIIAHTSAEDLNNLTLDTLRGKGQVLIFVNSRRSTQAAGRLLGHSVSQILSPDEKKELALLSRDVIGSPAEATKICRSLGELVRLGVAFHHAGLKPTQRKLIEDNFKKNLIKVICSTPTLAAGVNLPARRAIIRDIKRFESGLGSAFIPVSEYKQCAGRAGRPQYDEYGEAVIVAKSLSESKLLMDRYVKADPEPVTSKLGHASVLRIHILASIAGGYVHDVNDTLDFLSHTFLAHQRRGENLIGMIAEIFDFLNREGFIEKEGFRYFATTFGQVTSRLYIDPMTAIVLRDGLNKMAKGPGRHSRESVPKGTIPASSSAKADPPGGKIESSKESRIGNPELDPRQKHSGMTSSIGILQLICCSPDSTLLKVSNADFEELEKFSSTHDDELVFKAGELPVLQDIFGFLSVIKTVYMLSRWIEEEKEDLLCDAFNIGPGDIYRHIESTDWLLHAGMVIAELFQLKKLSFPMEDLRRRVKYGIKEELLDLVQLKGVGRIRARNLFAKGYKKLSDLKYLSVEELASVPQIGKTLAKDILGQIK